MARCHGRCWRIPSDEVVVNAMGLNNEGAEAIAEKVRSLKVRFFLDGWIPCGVTFFFSGWKDGVLFVKVKDGAS